MELPTSPGMAATKKSLLLVSILMLVLGVLTPTLSASGKAGGSEPPAPPDDLRLVSATRTELKLEWSRLKDEKVEEYEIYVSELRNDVLVDSLHGKTKRPTYTIGELECGTSYRSRWRPSTVTGIDRSSPARPWRPRSALEATPPQSAPSSSAPSGDGKQGTTSGSNVPAPAQPPSAPSSPAPSGDGKPETTSGSNAPAPTQPSAPATGQPSQETDTAAQSEKVAQTDEAPGDTGSGTKSEAQRGTVDGTAPTAPPNLRVVSATSSQLGLTWDRSKDNGKVVGYDVYLDDAMKGTTSRPGYTLDNLGCGTTHAVSVMAKDKAGNRSAPARATVATSACADVSPPSAPTNFRSEFTTTTSAILVWSASTDNVGVTSYGIYVAGVRILETPEPKQALTGLACGTTYYYFVDAADGAGNRSSKVPATITTLACTDGQPPTKPAPVTVLDATPSAVTVSWPTATDNVGVDHYNVYRGAAPVAETTSTSTTVTGLSCGTSYSIGVNAEDGAGNASDMASTVAQTDPCASPADTQSPSAPGALAATSASQTSIGVTWAPATDNVGVTGYTVYRDGAAAGTSTATSYTVSGLSCGVTYRVARGCLRRRRQPLRPYRGISLDGSMRRHDATPGARLGHNGLPDADEHLRHVARRDRQCRCRRVRRLQGRREGHGRCGAGVHLRGTHVRNELHARRRCVRRGRASLRGGDDGPHRDDRLRGHDRPDGADEPLRDVRHHDGAHALLVRGDRQRRSHEVRGLAQRDIGRVADDDLVESDRSLVRDVVFVRRPRRRRGRQPVDARAAQHVDHGVHTDGPRTDASADRRWHELLRSLREHVRHGRPSYFPIAVWGAYNQTQANRDLDAAAGLNTYVWAADELHGRHPCRRRFKVIQDEGNRANVGSETAGWVLATRSTCGRPTRRGRAAAATSSAASSRACPQDGRAPLRQLREGRHLLELRLGRRAVHQRLPARPRRTTSTGSPTRATLAPVAGRQPVRPRPERSQQAECRRASNYGDVVDRMRLLDAMDGARKPIWNFVETGRPFTDSWPGRTIDPRPQMRAAVWHSIIAGARGIIYFQHRSAGPASATTTRSVELRRHTADGRRGQRADQGARAGAQLADRHLRASPASPGVKAMVKWDGSNFYVFAGGRQRRRQRHVLDAVCRQRDRDRGRREPHGGRRAAARSRDSFADGNAVHIYRIDGGSRCGL